jgi:hypothetical protein
MREIRDVGSERQALRRAAGLIAHELLTWPDVKAVHLADILHPTDGPPYYVGPEFRLLVVVSDELTAKYLERRAKPMVIADTDGDDNGHTWSVERDERPDELPWHLLGTTIETFIDRVSLSMDELTHQWDARADLSEALQPDEGVEVILVRADWPEHLAELIALSEHDFNESNWRYAAATHEVFDPGTRTFVFPR